MGVLVQQGIELGTMLFTLVEPDRGHEVAYNRWYERDHFYAGCMIGAHCFAGDRFVATRPLKELRAPVDSPMTPDQYAGSGRRILVTGVTGWVGGALARSLAGANEVFGAARFADPAPRCWCRTLPSDWGNRP